MIEAYENGQVTTLVSLDQSLANDLIGHFKSKERLRIIGADEKTITLLASYLEGRSQYVELETKSSPRLKNEPCYIIQGSLGSCLRYAIGTADLPTYLHKDHDHLASQEEDCPSRRITLFVDDSNDGIKYDTVDKHKVKAQETVDRVEKYLTDNKLKQNKDKSKLMVMCNPGHIKDDAAIT